MSTGQGQWQCCAAGKVTVGWRRTSHASQDYGLNGLTKGDKQPGYTPIKKKNKTTKMKINFTSNTAVK